MGHYLQAFEICRMFRVSPKTIPGEELDQMFRLWVEFDRRFLWPQQQMEDNLHPESDDQHPKGCSLTECHHKPTPGVRSMLDEIHQWENFALANFETELRELQWA